MEKGWRVGRDYHWPHIRCNTAGYFLPRAWREKAHSAVAAVARAHTQGLQSLSSRMGCIGASGGISHGYGDR